MLFFVTIALLAISAFLLVIFIYVFISLIGMQISSSKDVPYVASSSKIIRNIIKRVKIDSNTSMLELGCGDARILRGVVSRTGATGIGVDSSVPFVFLAWVLSFTDWTFSKVKFYRMGIIETDFSKANVIYLFLMNEFINSKIFREKLIREAKLSTVIVSNWFEVPYFKKNEFARDVDGKHTTYFYRV